MTGEKSFMVVSEKNAIRGYSMVKPYKQAMVPITMIKTISSGTSG